MKAHHPLFHRMDVALAGVAIMLLGFAFAYAQNAPGKGKADGKDPGAKPEAKPRDPHKSRIKVFRLAHIDLETITPVLNSLLPESVDVPAVALGGGGALAGGASLGGGPPAGIGGGGALGLGGGGVGLGGGGLGLGGGGGMFGALGLAGGGANAPVSWRAAEDTRTKSLIVRGPERVIDLATDLVAVLDLPADKAMPTVKSLRAYKLKHAKAEELNTVLTNLELDARTVPVEKGNILIVTANEDVIKEIDGVVEALDIDVAKNP